LFRAAHDLPDLTDAQKDSLEKMEANLKTDDEGIRTAMKAFRADLIAGVKAGKLDTTKLTPDNAAVDKAIDAHKTQEATELDSLHTLLTPAQRTALVTTVRAKQAEHETRMMSWMQAKEADGGAQDWSKKRLDKMTAELTLDAGQQKQVGAILTRASDPPNAAGMQTRWDDMKKRHEALLTGFAGDTFDAKKADLTILPGKTAHEPMDHMVSFYTQLLPILHPDQQAKLAATLDKPFGGGGGPGPQMEFRARGPQDDMMFPFMEPNEGPPGAPPGRPLPP
jgi:Spy/CpxP family protein refolding chaperone